jgi:hypothetical protein
VQISSIHLGKDFLTMNLQANSKTASVLTRPTAAELREDPIQRGGWVMGLFLKVNRLDFFVPKERATGFAIVSSVDAIRAPKASSSATRPGQALGYFYLDAKRPSFSWARSQL